MAEELLQKLIDLVSKTAPELWRIGVRQAIIVGAKDVFWFVLAFIVVVIFINLGMKSFNWYADSSGEEKETAAFATLACSAFSTLLILVGLDKLSNGISHLLNPGYYAIQLLLELVK